MDKNLYTIAAAFTSAKEGDSINYHKLISAVRNYCKDVEKNLQGDDLQKFQEQVLLATLVSCPCVRKFQSISSHAELSGLFLNFPEMSNKTFILLSQSLSYQHYVHALLSHFPPSIIPVLLEELINSSKTLTPNALSLVFELAMTLISNSHSRDAENDFNIVGIFEQIASFFGKFVDKFDKNSHRNGSYLFLHSIALLHLVISLNSKKTFTSFSNLPIFGSKVSDNSNNLSFERYSIAKSLLPICKKLASHIDMNTWMAWNEVSFSPSLFSAHNCAVTNEKSVQTVISHEAHFLLTACNTDNEEKESKYNISSLFENYSELKVLLKHIAVDPYYDSDSELSLKDLVCELSKDLSEESQDELDLVISPNVTQKKYLSLIIQWDDTEELFGLEEVSRVLFAYSLEIDLAKCLLERFIAFKGEVSAMWKQAIVKCCASLDASFLKNSFEKLLQRDGKLQDWLKNSNYPHYLRTVCNTLSSVENVETTDLSGVWLACLQKPKSTVETLVDRAIHNPGLMGPTVHALHQLSVLCCYVTEGQSDCLLSRILMERLSAAPQLDMLSMARLLQLTGGVAGNSPSIARQLVKFAAIDMKRKSVLACKLIKGIVDAQSYAAIAGLSAREIVSVILQLCDLIEATNILITSPTEDFPASRQSCDDESSFFDCQDEGEPLEVSSAQETAEVQACATEVLSTLVGLVKEGDLESSNLLKHHLLTHCHPIPVSCYGILQPLLSQPPPLTLPSSPHPPSRQESPPIAPPQSPPATSSPRNVQLKTVFVSYSREEVTCIEHLFLTSDWSYVTWVCTLYQVLQAAPPSHWLLAIRCSKDAFFLHKRLKDTAREAGVPKNCPFPELHILKDVLRLFKLSSQQIIGVQAFAYAYDNFVTATNNYIRNRLSASPEPQQLQLLGSCFVWWCRHHVPCECDGPGVLACRLIAQLAEVLERSGAKKSLKPTLDEVFSDVRHGFLKYFSTCSMSSSIAMQCSKLSLAT